MNDLQSILEKYSANTTPLSLLPPSDGSTDRLSSAMRQWGSTAGALGLLTTRSSLANFFQRAYFLVIGKPYFTMSPIKLLDTYFSQTQQVNAGLSQHVDCLKTQLARTDEFCAGLIMSEGELKREYLAEDAALAKQRGEYATLVNKLSMTRQTHPDHVTLCVAEYNLHVALTETERKYLLLAVRIPRISEHIGGTRAVRDQLEKSLTFALRALQGTSDILVMVEQLRPVLEVTVLTGAYVERVTSEVQMLKGAAASVMKCFWDSAGAMTSAYSASNTFPGSTVGQRITSATDRVWQAATARVIAGCDKHLEQRGIPYLQVGGNNLSPTHSTTDSVAPEVPSVETKP